MIRVQCWTQYLAYCYSPWVRTQSLVSPSLLMMHFGNTICVTNTTVIPPDMHNLSLTEWAVPVGIVLGHLLPTFFWYVSTWPMEPMLTVSTTYPRFIVLIIIHFITHCTEVFIYLLQWHFPHFSFTSSCRFAGCLSFSFSLCFPFSSPGLLLFPSVQVCIRIRIRIFI